MRGPAQPVAIGLRRRHGPSRAADSLSGLRHEIKGNLFDADVVLVPFRLGQRSTLRV